MPSVQQRGPPGTPVPRSGNATNSKYAGRFPDTYFKRGQSKGKPRWVATSECYGLDAAECKTSPKCIVGRRGCKRTRSDKGGRHKKRASGSRARATQSQASQRGQARTRRSASRSRSPQRSPPPRRSSRLARQTSRSPPRRSPPRRSPPRRTSARVLAARQASRSPRQASRSPRQASRSPPRRTSPRVRQAARATQTTSTKLSKSKKKK